MQHEVPESELKDRMERFRERMNAVSPDWELATIFGKINQYYFTGTMQDGMLLIPRDGDAIFWIRRSYERALDESLFPDIRKMESFRDAAKEFDKIPDTIHIETELVPIALLERFKKHFPATLIQPLDIPIAAVRSVKSPYELSLMEESGKIHQRILEVCVPDMLSEGISEAMFIGELYTTMLREGHHGVVRFGMFDIEMGIGQIGFGESSLYPTYFDGPGGNRGMSPAVPVLGSRDRTLQPGDLVFADIGCGAGGYHTDKTMTYMFGRSLPEEAIVAHHQCVEIQHTMASMLKPGITPAEIYESIMADLKPDFLQNFMGYGNRQAKFLGHGIGLQVDEMPVIAKGFTEPLVENMVFALEPKKGIPKVGMVGIENTFIVTRGGGRCITGDHPGLMPLY